MHIKTSYFNGINKKFTMDKTKIKNYYSLSKVKRWKKYFKHIF